MLQNKSSTGTIKRRRALATILFADIVGSTRQIVGLDEEAVPDLLDGAIAHMSELVHKYGGVVARVQGDGLMALFGAPEYVEDHALVAGRAAIEIRDFFAGDAHSFDVRLGLHAGNVITRIIYSDFGAAFDPVGTVVHVAAKAEKVAAPNTVLVTETVQSLIGNHATFTDFGDLQIDEENKVRLLELNEVADYAGSNKAPRQLKRLIGRDEELASLKSWLFEPGRRQHVGLVGEAGIGKSRVAEELTAYADKTGYSVIEVQGLGRKKATPYGALTAFLDAALTHSAHIGHSEIEASRIVREWLKDGAASAYSLSEFERASVQFLIGLAQSTPLFLSVEDMHDLDVETIRWLNLLKREKRCENIPILITGRPLVAERLQKLVEHVQFLEPLNRDEAAKLIIQVEPDHQFSETQLEQILDRSEGVPFFVQEFSRMARRTADVEIAEAPLPMTVENFITSRLNDLSLPATDFLLAASVLGAEFDLDIVFQLVRMSAPEIQESVLNELIGAQIIGFGEQGALVFRHQLYCDGTLNRLLGSQKQAFDAVAAEALSEKYGDQPERAEQISAHYEKAGHIEKTIEFRLKAVKLAVRRSANHAVADIFKRTIIYQDDVSDDARIDLSNLILASADSLIQLGHADLLVPALHYVCAPQSGNLNTRREALARGNLAFLGWFTGNLNEGFDHANRALQIKDIEKDLPSQSLNLFALALIQHSRGELDAAMRTHQKLIDKLEAVTHPGLLGASLVPLVRSHTFKAWMLSDMGRLTDAARHCNAARAHLANRNQPYSELLEFSIRGRVLSQCGDLEAAETALSQARAICLQEKQFAMEPCITGWLAMVLAQKGRAKDTLALARSSFESGLYKAGGPAAQGELLFALFHTALQSGEIEVAESALNVFDEICSRSGVQISTAYCNYSRAKLAEVRDHPYETTVQLLEDALCGALKLGLVPLAADCLDGLANANRVRGFDMLAADQAKEASYLRRKCKRQSALKLLNSPA